MTAPFEGPWSGHWFPGLAISATLQARMQTVVKKKLSKHQLAPVVQKVDSAIHWINHYPLDSAICFPNTFPWDSDLSDG